jgi:hypothetical protein
MLRSIFDLKTDVDELMYDNLEKMEYREIAPTRDIKGSNFSNGQIVYRYRTTGDEWSLFNRSYLRARIRLSKTDDNILQLADNVAPNMNLLANIFQTAEIKINNKTVSRVNNFLPQVDILENRLMNSSSHLDSIGDYTNFMDPNVENRQQDVITGGTGRKSKDFELIWKPLCLSLFKIDHALPCGDFEICLTPRSNALYQLYGIEATAAGVDLTKFKLEIVDMYYEACIVSGPRIDNLTYIVPLCQTRCQGEKVKSESLQKRSFTISPSTNALTIAYQDVRVGSNPRLSASKFISQNNAINAIQSDKLVRMYVQYAGQQYPHKDKEIVYSQNDKDYTTNAYLETQINNGAYFDTGGAEFYSDYNKRGLYYHYKVKKGGTNRATEAYVSQQFVGGTDIENTRVLLFDHSKQVARIKVQDGQIVDVQLTDA